MNQFCIIQQNLSSGYITNIINFNSLDYEAYPQCSEILNLSSAVKYLDFAKILYMLINHINYNAWHSLKLVGYQTIFDYHLQKSSCKDQISRQSHKKTL